MKKGAKKLAQTAAEQAISGATKAGIDILKGKVVIEAVQQRTAQAVNRTSQAASQAVKRSYDQMVAPNFAKTSALDLAPVPVKKKRKKLAGDIFD